MWIIDKILRFFSDDTEKVPPEEFKANIDKIEAALAEHDFDEEESFDSEAVETLYVEYEEGSPLPPQGILKDMGYRVGKNGLLIHERRQILKRTFQIQLDSNSDWYVRQWGPRCSQARFNKMDRVLGGLAANAEKIRKNDMSEAIRNWRQDQEWLRLNYRNWMDHTH